MPVLQARIHTDRPTRYLVQFCRHAAAMGGGHAARRHLHLRQEVEVAAECGDTDGRVTFGSWGQATLTADGDLLTVRIDAVDEERLSRIRDLVSRDLGRFSGRNPLAVNWHRLDEPPGTQHRPVPVPAGSPDAAPRRDTVEVPSGQRRGFLRSHLRSAVLAVAAVLVVALHVGLLGSVVAESRWTGLAANAVVALAALKIALIVVARFKIRQRRANTPSERS